MGLGRLSYPFPLWFLCPAVLLSGATALLYEIVWTRRLSLVLGSTTEAAAAVLSAFMLGLALGALVVGRRADVSRRPLRWYGVLEIGVGLYALFFDSILALFSQWFPGNPWALAAALLVLPAALMGGTLPVLARAGAHTTQRGTLAFGNLYGYNTLGAVAGALLTTFVVLEAFGLAGSVRIAAGVNIVLGIAFWGVSQAVGPREVWASEEEKSPQPATGDAEIPVVVAFFLAGFAGLALEMAWIRYLVYFLEGFTIAFGLMLATYLLGLGAGAIAGTYLALLVENPRRLLARVLLLQAVFAVATYLLGDTIGLRLEEMRSSYNRADAIDFSYGLSLFLAAGAVILPPTFCAGMLLPIVSRIALSDRESIGRQAGVVYAATTLGAVIAPPVAGFVLIPALGVPWTIAAMAGLILLGGTWVAFGRGIREWIPAAAAALLFTVVCVAGGLDEPVVEKSHVFATAKTPRRLRVFREGKTAGVSVVEELDDGTRLLYLDDFSAAETSRQYGYMRMLGHLPVLLHEKPENVLVIAFGTGTTAGAVSVHPEVKRIDCVEIEPEVYEVAGEFAEQNRNVLADPRTNRIVADGREFVRRNEGVYDVVTLEPLMPYSPAAVYLYTKEFYEAARRSLHRGGLLCQWIPPQGVSQSDLRRLVASVNAVFPHVSVWYFEHAVLVLGADQAPKIDGASFLARCGREVLEDLIRARVGSPAHLLGAHVCSGAALEQALAGADPMVDDRTDLEFRPLPRRFGKRSQTYHAENLEFLARIHQNEVAWLKPEPVEGVRLAITGMGAALDTLALEMRRRVEGGEVVPAAAIEAVVSADPQALFARSIRDRRLYAELMGAMPPRYDEAARLALAPDRSKAYVALADQAEGEKRLYYLTLAVRENALLDPALLRELAASLAGPAKRFCLNRANAVEGKPLEEGEEALPALELPDLGAALGAWDEDSAREILEDADKAGLRDDMERDAWTWWREQAREKRRDATLLLHRIGSSNAWRAALKLAYSADPEDAMAAAPILCPRYPQDKTWEKLARNDNARVRAAAADAAAAGGNHAHLPALAELCRDDVADVRLSAFLAFRTIEPEADEAGYDPRDPSDEAKSALDRLAGNGRQAAAK